MKNIFHFLFISALNGDFFANLDNIYNFLFVFDKRGRYIFILTNLGYISYFIINKIMR